ncbi:uncharacterized protein LOC107844198 [Capsicum annuum]|uniref:uncharacterized protein LOC107844198 n=1 Tax=Capsicum annuum TaxID=4072 RepID=UPI0007BEF18F|nr:uncharacterized protein LOC107844198 [Capsicum annuum]
MRVGSQNIKTLQGKSIELVKILRKRKINIAGVQETKWVGFKARDVDRYKLWYSGSNRCTNGVGILVYEKLREQAVEVKMVSDRVMTIKLVLGGFTLNICSAYAPQVCLDEKEKKSFGEVLDEVVRDISSSEKIFIGGDFNGQIESLLLGYDDVHRGFGFGVRNDEGAALLDFRRAFGESTRKVLGILRDGSGRYPGDWWWNEDVKKKGEMNKAAYAKLVEGKDEEQKRRLS